MRWRKTGHIFCPLKLAVEGVGASGEMLSPPPPLYFPADSWIVHVKTTYPLFSSCASHVYSDTMDPLYSGSVVLVVRVIPACFEGNRLFTVQCTHPLDCADHSRAVTATLTLYKTLPPHPHPLSQPRRAEISAPPHSHFYSFSL
jgi:hypothetical protein